MNEKTTCDILIRNTSILDENFQIRRSIFIAIQNGTILSITSEEPSCPLQPQKPSMEKISCGCQAL